MNERESIEGEGGRTCLISKIGTKWPTIEERRDYFMKLARDHGFDPLVADNWYRIKPKALDRHQVLLSPFLLCFSSSAPPLFSVFTPLFSVPLLFLSLFLGIQSSAAHVQVQHAKGCVGRVS